MPETSSANAALPRRARIWSLRWQEGDSERESAARSLELALGIRPLTARLLCNRGYDDPAAAATFLSHGGMQPHDPFLLTDMQPAVSRVLAAVRDGETVAVYGDYDVDGVTSVTCLYLYLRGLGVPVVRYIPNRLREGYGMSRTGVDALSYCQDLLVRFGGHELAAGLCIRRQDIPAFRERLNEYAAAHLTDDMTAQRQEAECRVTADELTMEQARELELLEPCGTANPVPLLMLENATVQQITALSGGKHTRLSLYADGRLFQALWFGMPTSALPVQTGDRVDVLFQLGINEYHGVESLQLILRDVRHSAAEEREKAAADERLASLLAGGGLSPEEGLLPDRDDVARVYVCLRERVRNGSRTVRTGELRARLAAAGAPMCYVKLMLILRILNEMAVCRIEDVGDGILTYEITPDAPHTSVEASPLLRSLRERCGKGTAPA